MLDLMLVGSSDPLGDWVVYFMWPSGDGAIQIRSDLLRW